MLLLFLCFCLTLRIPPDVIMLCMYLGQLSPAATLSILDALWGACTRNVWAPPTGGHEGLADTYIQGLASARSPAVRQGSAAALRALPYRLLQPHWRAALIALGQASQVCRCPPD